MQESSPEHSKHSAFWSILKHSGACTNLVRSILKHSGAFSSILEHSGAFLSILKHSTAFWSILVFSRPPEIDPRRRGLPDSIIVHGSPLTLVIGCCVYLNGLARAPLPVTLPVLAPLAAPMPVLVPAVYA